MAHRIVGIDLGSYSVKVAVVSAGLRKSTVVDWLELAIPPPGEEHEPLEVRQARVVGEILKQRGWDHDSPYATIAGDALSLRILDFPFHGLKRAELDRAVGAELEAQLPHELDDMVYAYDTLPRELLAVPAEGGNGMTVGTRILAAASTRERVSNLIATLAGDGAEPHGVIAAPTAYARIAEGLAAIPGASGETVMVVDLGHARTNACIVLRGRAIFARTLSRGGRHVTQAIAKTWGMSMEDAERAKHSDGFVASSRERAPSDAWARISETVTAELAPLARELRQTIAACRVQTGAEPTRVVLLGGGARLRGMASWLTDELELPVAGVSPDDGLRLFGPALRGRPADHALLALRVPWPTNTTSRSCARAPATSRRAACCSRRCSPATPTRRCTSCAPSASSSTGGSPRRPPSCSARRSGSRRSTPA
jgi:type IV pilus assembly protein PilM